MILMSTDVCMHLLKALVNKLRQCITCMDWYNTSKDNSILNSACRFKVSYMISLKISATVHLDHSNKTNIKNLRRAQAWLWNLRFGWKNITCSEFSGKQQNAKLLASYFQPQQWSCSRQKGNKIQGTNSSQHAAKPNFLLILSPFC